MDKEKFADIMRHAFASYGRDMDTVSGKRMMASWYKFFGKENSDDFASAFDRHIMVNSAQPKVSDVIGLLKGNKENHGKHACPDCGESVDNLYRLGPDYPKCVCIECHGKAHAYRRIMEMS